MNSSQFDLIKDDWLGVIQPNTTSRDPDSEEIELVFLRKRYSLLSRNYRSIIFWLFR